jgi:hypothetical protein
MNSPSESCSAIFYRIVNTLLMPVSPVYLQLENGYQAQNLETFVINVVLLAAKVAINYE